MLEDVEEDHDPERCRGAGRDRGRHREPGKAAWEGRERDPVQQHRQLRQTGGQPQEAEESPRERLRVARAAHQEHCANYGEGGLVGAFDPGALRRR